MPGVTVLPSPTSGGFASTTPTRNGFTTKSPDDMSVEEIKEKAQDTVKREAKNASPSVLIRIAKTQMLKANECETNGELKNALSALTKVASLSRLVFNSQEYKEEQKGKKGALIPEFKELLKSCGLEELGVRINGLEKKLAAMASSTPTGNEDNPPFQSIADRVRSLQDAGLATGKTKRPPNGSTPPTSPRTNRIYTQPPSPISLSSLVPNTPVSSSSSPHSFVSPSTLGPPSPSPPSSPPASIDLSEFSQSFPTIDELDETLSTSPQLTLPSVPTGSSSSKSPSPFRTFTLNIPDRPASTPTPITPTTLNTFTNTSLPTAIPPTFPKPSNLSSPPTSSLTPDKPGLPVTSTVFPKELVNYIRNNENILLLDVRTRAEFTKEHIMVQGVVCLEPSVMLRENLTSQMIEDSLVLAPKQESSMFANRDKFSSIIVYDNSSTTFGSAGSRSPLYQLVQAIYEHEFTKILKNSPALLVGGLEAWKKERCDEQIAKAGVVVPEEAQSIATPLPSSLTNGFSAGLSSISSNPHQVWTPPSRPTETSKPPVAFDQTRLYGHKSQQSLDQIPNHSRSPAESSGSILNGGPAQPLARKPAILRSSISGGSYSRNISTPPIPPNGSSSITYPQFSPQFTTGSPFVSPPSHYSSITSPPQASLNPSLSRRRSDYIDQSQEALASSLTTRQSIDYPELSSSHVLRPPPAAASSALERQDNRPRVVQTQTQALLSLSSAPMQSRPTPPRIQSDYPVTYWSDIQIGTSGLKNLGNTCYMNSTIQCLSATVPFARFFTDGRWRTAVNRVNVHSSQGRITEAFAKLVHQMWQGQITYITPIDFRKSICQLKQQYNNTDQHDSQEFLSFLLDGIHEDLNRVIQPIPSILKPEEEAELERLPQQIASDREFCRWKTQHDSIIVDYFQGQFRNRLECLTCHHTSTTFNVFSILQLPIPHGYSGKVPLQRCLDSLLTTEVMANDDAWDCPKCKVKRKATKQLSLSRLPPILVIHLKRFESNGRFSDKVDTFVDYPLKSLDLTNFMPPSLPPGVDVSELNGGLKMPLDDPRQQSPPYKYDLYGVTNHYGNLSSGHYTAFIASRGSWMYCDDSSIKPVDTKQVVAQKAYVLFYKRVKA